MMNRVFMLLWLLLAMAGCRSSALVCETSQNCPAEDACIDRVCRKRACIVSGDCQIGQHCDQVDGQCKAGCLDDADCYYGEACGQGQCQPRGCRSTQLDCKAGEYCDPTTGACFKAAGPYCVPCVSDADCGGGNNFCFSHYCAPECDATHPCPAGYGCLESGIAGNVVVYNCITQCETLNDIPAARTPAPAARR
jgi:hypothetical protein